MKEALYKIVHKALEDQGFLSAQAGPVVTFSLEHPKDMGYGDYAVNAALIIAQQTKTNPQDVAARIVAGIQEQHISFIETLSVAGPGFINITLKRSFFIDAVQEAVSVSTYGNTNTYKGKTILVEHSSPNLFKPFHIGHLMNNTVGEAITRLAKVSSATVHTLSFPSDISLGVAKAIFILLEKYGPTFEPTNVSVLGDAYVEGVRRYQEAEEAQPCGSMVYRVKEIADNLYAGNDSPEWAVFQKCKAFNINYFEQVVAKLGSHFDGYIYESEAGVEGKKIVQKYTPDVFTESEGAIVYVPKEDTKLHTAVFLNSQGNPTYEAKDLGLLELKFNTYNPDHSIFITDEQQVSHFNVVLDAVKHINPSWTERSLHRYHGRMTFKGQKMSSRLGGVPLAEEVIATIVEEVKQKNPDSTDTAAQEIAIGAIKFAILRAKAGMSINFDPDTSLSFEGDSGPYLQYTAVRALSLIQKGADQNITPLLGVPVEGTETLERLIARFPDIVADAQQTWAPHTVVGYLLDIAQAFNSWYGQGKIIDEDREKTAYRLAVVAGTRQVLINGLWMLGISVPEKM